jgi:hypothetical protein
VHVVSVFSHQAYRGIPQGSRFVGRLLPRSEDHEGASNIRFRQVRAAICVIPYVLYGGLYCLTCRLMCIVPLERVPAHPYILLGDKIACILVQYELRSPTRVLLV